MEESFPADPDKAEKAISWVLLSIWDPLPLLHQAVSSSLPCASANEKAHKVRLKPKNTEGQSCSQDSGQWERARIEPALLPLHLLPPTPKCSGGILHRACPGHSCISFIRSAVGQKGMETVNIDAALVWYHVKGHLEPAPSAAGMKLDSSASSHCPFPLEAP